LTGLVITYIWQERIIHPKECIKNNSEGVYWSNIGVKVLDSVPGEIICIEYLIAI
jgi:hypothetical protein